MINQSFIAEVNHEAASTKRVLERVPGDRLDFKPHEKSMTLGKLSVHLAELLDFMKGILTMDEFDFTKGHFKPLQASTTAELQTHFQQKLDDVIHTLNNTSDEAMNEIFTLRSGDQVFAAIPRMYAIRPMALNHLIHHRGQLTVYLRLLDIPVPGLYGPSADER